MTNGPFSDDAWDAADPTKQSAPPPPPPPPPTTADPAEVATAKRLLARTELKQLGGGLNREGLTAVTEANFLAFRKAHPGVAKPVTIDAFGKAFREIIEETFG